MAAIEPKSPHTEEALFLEGPPDLTDDVQEGSHQQQGLFHKAGSFSSLQGLQQGSQIIGGMVKVGTGSFLDLVEALPGVRQVGQLTADMCDGASQLTVTPSSTMTAASIATVAVTTVRKGVRQSVTKAADSVKGGVTMAAGNVSTAAGTFATAAQDVGKSVSDADLVVTRTKSLRDGLRKALRLGKQAMQQQANEGTTPPWFDEDHENSADRGGTQSGVYRAGESICPPPRLIESFHAEMTRQRDCTAALRSAIFGEEDFFLAPLASAVRGGMLTSLSCLGDWTTIASMDIRKCLDTIEACHCSQSMANAGREPTCSSVLDLERADNGCVAEGSAAHAFLWLVRYLNMWVTLWTEERLPHFKQSVFKGYGKHVGRYHCWLFQQAFAVAAAFPPEWDEVRRRLEKLDADGEPGVVECVTALQRVCERMEGGLRKRGLWDESIR